MNALKDKKRVAVVTGTRAEYGLLRPVVQKLLASKSLCPQLLVTGAHLRPEYGNTVAEIEADGLPIAARLDILRFGQGPLALADTVAETIRLFARWFAENRPAAALVLGDRYEIFAAAQAAALTGVPVAHISGGDVTVGAADDYYRHCITKIAAVHFPSCAQYAARLVRMGEQPAHVYNVGGLGDENLRKLPKMSREELSASVGMDLSAPFALVTFHPETAPGAPDPLAQLAALLTALDTLHEETGLRTLITKSNADAGGAAINAAIDTWAEARPDYVRAHTSLGARRYLSAMCCAAVVAGNSSSGVVETPTLGVPAVNIGDRQRGRILCPNVLCCPAERPAIQDALRTALSPGFAAAARNTVSPYNGGDTSARIVAALEQELADPGFGSPKLFYDGE